MDMFDPTSAAIARAYDSLPYESRPFPQSHPARTSAIARLFGLQPTNIETARVLELGCAAGGNIIPMAAMYPDAQFLGVDLSSRQIDDGQRRIKHLGLTNVTLRHQSILDFSAGDGRFDYVICHGVYSWVPHPVRAAILRICAENLVDTGLAYISYNVFPGWRLRSVLRDAMMFHKNDRNPGDAVAETRAFLNNLAQLTNPSSPYGQMLRQEANALANQGDYYIAHEYLEHTNDPCHVTDFLRDAQTRNLTYLTDVNLSMSIAENFGTDAGRLLRQISDNRLERMEQYIDFLTGRTFRQSILVKNAQNSSIKRNLDPTRLETLHVQANVKSSDTSSDTLAVENNHGHKLTLTDAKLHQALVELGRNFPKTNTVDKLAEETGADKGLLLDAAFKMVIAGMADVRTSPIATASKVSDMPTASAIAQSDARIAQSWTTNAAHDSIGLTPVQIALLPLLDGTRDKAALIKEIAERSHTGSLVFTRDGKALTDPDDVLKAAEEHVAAALTSLATYAILVDA